MVVKQLLNVDSNNRTKYVSSDSDFVPNYLKIPSVNHKVILNERSLNDRGLKTEVKQNNPCSSVISDSECEVKILKIRVANGDPDFIETDLTEDDQNYQNLLELLCKELNVPLENVERIRK